MKLTDDKLRRLTTARLSELRQERPAALGRDLLVKAATDQLTAAERAELARALAEDPAAVEQFRLAKSVATSVDDSALTRVLEQSRARGRPIAKRLTPLALAAALLVAIGGGVLLVWQPQASEGLVRGGADVTPPNGAALERQPEVFAWPPGRAGSQVQIELVDARGQVVWLSSRQQSDQTEVPPEVRARLKPGAYQWRVIDGAGSAADASWYSFTVR